MLFTLSITSSHKWLKTFRDSLYTHDMQSVYWVSKDPSCQDHPDLSMGYFVLPSHLSPSELLEKKKKKKVCPKTDCRGRVVAMTFPSILHFLSQSPTFASLLSVIPNTQDLEHCLWNKMFHEKHIKNFVFHSCPQAARKASFLLKVNVWRRVEEYSSACY